MSKVKVNQEVIDGFADCAVSAYERIIIIKEEKSLDLTIQDMIDLANGVVQASAIYSHANPAG